MKDVYIQNCKPWLKDTEGQAYCETPLVPQLQDVTVLGQPVRLTDSLISTRPFLRNRETHSKFHTDSMGTMNSLKFFLQKIKL